MNIQAEKIQLAKWLLETQNPKVIESIKDIFKKDKEEDFWHELSPSQKAEIELALKQAENEEVIDYEDFIENHR